MYSLYFTPLRNEIYFVIDLHIPHLLLTHRRTEPKAKSTDSDSAGSSCMSSSIMIPSIDILLLRFIRYLQLINFLPWLSPFSICHHPSEPAVCNKSDVLRPVEAIARRQNENQFSKLGLCGLVNIGNSCYMNSAIQCLSHVPKLTEWAKEQQPLSRQNSVTNAYSTLIESMWSGEKPYVNPSAVKHSVSQHASIFADYAQKDSHEFMNSLLNALHSDYQQHNPSSDQPSIVTDLFRIRTDSRVTCSTCGNYDSNEDTTYCLPLPLEEQSRVTLATLLQEFLHEEQLDGLYYCSHCNELRSAKQKTSLCHPLPPVIIVQLRRFTFDETDYKLNTFVEYPVNNWNVDGNSDFMYDLCAVSMHAGDLKSGHYTTCARLNSDDRWYRFNDSQVEPIVDIRNIVHRNAYVLVYRKKS